MIHIKRLIHSRYTPGFQIISHPHSHQQYKHLTYTFHITQFHISTRKLIKKSTRKPFNIKMCKEPKNTQIDNIQFSRLDTSKFTRIIQTLILNIPNFPLATHNNFQIMSFEYRNRSRGSSPTNLTKSVEIGIEKGTRFARPSGLRKMGNVLWS